jgi:trigger factor
VTVKKGDVAAKYATVCKDLIKTAQVPGFRKGHVPLSGLERKYGDSLKASTGDALVEEARVKIDQSDIDAELKLIQDRNALVVDKSDDATAEMGDVATVDYIELDAGTGDKTDTERKDFVLTIGDKANFYQLDDHIIGMKKGDTRVVEAGPEKDKKQVRVTLTALKRRDLPAIDDDLAQDVSEKYKTLADLTADIKKQLTAQADHAVREQKVRGILEQLSAKNPIDLPASMVDNQVEASWERMIYQFMDPNTGQVPAAFVNMKEQLKPELSEKAEKEIRESLIIHSLIEERKIEATEDDLKAERERLVNEEELTEDYVKKIFDDKQEVERLKHFIIEKKLIDQLFTEVKVTKGKAITLKDLMNPPAKDEK